MTGRWGGPAREVRRCWGWGWGVGGGVSGRVERVYSIGSGDECTATCTHSPHSRRSGTWIVATDGPTATVALVWDRIGWDEVGLDGVGWGWMGWGGVD